MGKECMKLLIWKSHKAAMEYLAIDINLQIRMKKRMIFLTKMLNLVKWKKADH
jgi:hypothetical protein